MLSFHERRTLSNVSAASRTIKSCKSDRPQDINSELDELDREEFYRLKKVNSVGNTVSTTMIAEAVDQVSNKKQRDIAAADAEAKARREQALKEDDSEAADALAPSDILGQLDDKDIIF